MRWSLSLLLMLLMAGLSFAQVVYEPPPRLAVYNPYYVGLDLHRIGLLRAISERGPVPQYPRGTALIDGGFSDARVLIPGEIVPIYESVNFDPQTGQPLHFRKGDLMPQPQSGEQAQNAAHRTPAGEAQLLPGMRSGEIRITPHRARAVR